MILYIVTYLQNGNATTVCGAFEFEDQAIEFCEEQNSNPYNRSREYSYEEFCLGVMD